MDCGPTGKGEVRSYKTFSTISRMCIGTLKWFVERKAVEDSLILQSITLGWGRGLFAYWNGKIYRMGGLWI
jgi:hypothetical protein